MMNRADLMKFAMFLNENFLTYKLKPDLVVNAFLAMNEDAANDHVCECEAAHAVSASSAQAIDVGKLYVVGAGDDGIGAVCAAVENQQGLIVVVNSNDMMSEFRDIQTKLPSIVSLPKDHSIELIPRSIEFERIEKPKHKGHERPYKFHR